MYCRRSPYLLTQTVRRCYAWRLRWSWGRRQQRPAAVRPTFRPTLEGAEERILLGETVLGVLAAAYALPDPGGWSPEPPVVSAAPASDGVAPVETTSFDDSFFVSLGTSAQRGSATQTLQAGDDNGTVSSLSDGTFAQLNASLDQPAQPSSSMGSPQGASGTPSNPVDPGTASSGGSTGGTGGGTTSSGGTSGSASPAQPPAAPPGPASGNGQGAGNAIGGSGTGSGSGTPAGNGSGGAAPAEIPRQQPRGGLLLPTGPLPGGNGGSGFSPMLDPGGGGGPGGGMGMQQASITLTASPSPSPSGTGVTLTATVSGLFGTPTGTIYFSNITGGGNVPLGSSTLVPGLTTGSATATLSPPLLPTGMLTLAAVYNGNSTYAGVGATCTEMVGSAMQQASVSLSSSPNPSWFTQSVTLSAAVSGAAGTPTGTVSFSNITGGGNVSLGNATLTNGVATLSTTSLPAGDLTLKAVYNGDSTYASGASNTHTQTVEHQALPTIALTSSPNPSNRLQNVQFTADVSGISLYGTPTGDVAFYNGGTELADETLVAGFAVFSTATLPKGTLSLSAVYTPDLASVADYSSATAALTQTVNAYDSRTALSAVPSTYGQAVVLTATVTPASSGPVTPTGSVTFYADGTWLGSAYLDSCAVATLTTATLPAGTRQLSAVYGGDDNYLSSSDNRTQTVSPATTTTSLISSQNPSTYSQSVTFTANVAVVSPGGGTPVGTVTFSDGGTTLGTVALSSGQATLTTRTLGGGPHTITAQYNGTSNYLASSITLGQTVNKATTSVSVTTAVSPTVWGQSASFTATVSTSYTGASAPTGTVTFLDGSTTPGTVTLSGSSATFTTTALEVVSHTITAVYNGDSNFLSSSNYVQQTVNKASTTTALSSNVNPAVFGQALVLTAFVSPVSPGAGTPTGTVTFAAGGTTLGTATVTSSGSATLTLSSLAVGSYAIAASYGGDSHFLSSYSALYDQVVQRALTRLTLTSSAPLSDLGQSVTFTATVSPLSPGSGTPTGTVLFEADGSALGSTSLNGSAQATISTSALPAGVHTIAAKQAQAPTAPE